MHLCYTDIVTEVTVQLCVNSMDKVVHTSDMRHMTGSSLQVHSLLAMETQITSCRNTVRQKNFDQMSLAAPRAWPRT